MGQGDRSSYDRSQCLFCVMKPSQRMNFRYTEKHARVAVVGYRRVSV